MKLGSYFSGLTVMGLVGALVLSATPVRGDILIDSFKTGQSVTSPPSPNSGFVVTGGTDIIGTERYISTNKVSGPVGPPASTVSGQVFGDPTNVFSFSQDALTLGTATIVYDGVGGNTPVNAQGFGANGIDFTEGGLSNSFTFAEQGDFGIPASITVYDALTGTAYTASGTTNGGLAFEQRSIPFSSFGGYDFENVGAIVFNFNFGPGAIEAADISFKQIVVTTPTEVGVPEPSTLLLGCLGLGAAGLYRRYRRIRKA